MSGTVVIEAEDLGDVHPVVQKTKALLLDLDAETVAKSLAERLLLCPIDSFAITTDAVADGIAEAIDEIDEEVFTTAVEHVEETIRELLTSEAKEIALELFRGLARAGVKAEMASASA